MEKKFIILAESGWIANKSTERNVVFTKDKKEAMIWTNLLQAGYYCGKNNVDGFVLDYDVVDKT